MRPAAAKPPVGTARSARCRLLPAGQRAADARLVARAERPRPTPGADPRLAQAGRQAAASKPQTAEEDLKTVKLQDASVEGVARVEEEELYDTSKVLQLVVGDLAAILLFAVIGRINHGEVLDVETLATAAPFWAGWLLTGPLLGAYGRAAQGGHVGPAAAAAARTWAVATPVSLAIRSAVRGYVPATPFIIVAFTATGVLLIGWRAALAAATKPLDQMTALEKFNQRRRSGSPLEFMQLLTSLTKRW